MEEEGGIFDFDATDNGSDFRGMGADFDSLPNFKNSGLTTSMIQTLVLVHSMRADIVCQRSVDRKCGYLIQPKVWFIRFNDGVKAALVGLGLEPKKVYVNPEEITRILHSVQSLKWLLKNPKGYEMVRHLNGVLKQPRNHEEVIEALSLLDSTYESL